MSHPRTSLRALLAVCLSAALAVPAAAGSRGQGQAFRIRVPSRAGTAVRRAVLSARLRLANESCRKVLADFRSVREGRPLDAVLRDRGRTAEAHLDSLVFKDGTGRRRCASPAILAFTNVDSDTVYVCAGSFSRVAERDPAFADVVVIHEALHTLGLGENPPSSGEITARIEERCGG